MKLEELQTISRGELRRPSAQMMIALQHRANGKVMKGQVPARPTNRAARRAAKHQTSPFSGFGHLYAGTVPAEEVEKRRAANKQSRKARAINRKASR